MAAIRQLRPLRLMISSPSLLCPIREYAVRSKRNRSNKPRGMSTADIKEAQTEWNDFFSQMKRRSDDQSLCKSPSFPASDVGIQQPFENNHSVSPSVFMGHAERILPQLDQIRVPRKVLILWDLRYRPPKSIDPFVMAMRLRDIAARLGATDAELIAYGNRPELEYIPGGNVLNVRKQRRVLQMLEAQGLIKVGKIYECSYCGNNFRTAFGLKNHFKTVHAKERAKMCSRLDSLPNGTKKDIRGDAFVASSERYHAAKMDVLATHSDLGYALAVDLKRAGLYVKMVPGKADAAEEALRRHLNRAIRERVDCICLVSEHSGFVDLLTKAQEQRLHLIAVGTSMKLLHYVDVWISWADLASGIALVKLNKAVERWYPGESVFNDHWSMNDSLSEPFANDSDVEVLQPAEPPISENHVESLAAAN